MDLRSKIMNALVTSITASCITAIDEDDATRVNLVKKGVFQDDPIDMSPVVVIQPNFRDTSDGSEASVAWMDERDEREMGMGMSAVEFWKRRFVVKIIVWPAGEGESDAEEINGSIVSRVRRTLTTSNLAGLQDDYGERIVIAVNPIVKMKCKQTGGPPDEYGWDTTLFLEYLTEYVPR